LAPSKERASFLIFICGYVLWLNPLLLVQLHDKADRLGYFLAQCILAGGAIFVWALGNFVVTFSSPDERSRLRFRLFSLHFLLLFVFAFTRLLQTGITKTEAGLLPIKGPLQPYFDLTVVLYGAYFVSICLRTYRASTDELFRCQLRALVWSCLPSFLVGLCTNAILPGAFGNFQLTPTGGVWLLLFFAGVAYILSNGPFLLVRSELQKLYDEPAFRDRRNTLQLANLLGASEDVLVGKIERLSRMFSFRDEFGQPKPLVLSTFANSSEKNREQKIDESGLILPTPEGPLHATVRRFAAARQFNIRAAERLIGQTEERRTLGSLKSSSEVPPTITAETTTLQELYLSLDAVLVRAKHRWGYGIVDLSSCVYETLVRLEELGGYKGIILLVGEPGSGRRTIARASAKTSLASRDMGGLSESAALEIILGDKSALILTGAFSLLRGPRHTLEQISRRGAKTYFVLDHHEFQRAFETGNLAVYDFLQTVRVPSLREREEDFPFLAADIIREYTSLSGSQLQMLEQAAMDCLLSRKWRGNFFELRYVLRTWIENSESNVLSLRELELALRSIPNETLLAESIRESFGNAEASV